MDWEKVKIFRYVAQSKSFTHAGEKLNLSQSAISRQIKKLEEEENSKLVKKKIKERRITLKKRMNKII